MQFNTWLFLVVTTIGMSLTPGPNAMLVLTHGVLHGTRRTLFTIAGGLLGFALVIGFCLFGIAALIQASVHWLTLLKWAGGIYLVWIGISLWRAPPIGAPDAAQQGESAGPGRLFRQGFFSALANPKAILLFSAFLPQFIDARRPVALQFVIVTTTYLVVEFAVEYLIASGAGRVRPWLRRIGRRFNQVCGGMFVAVGAMLPLRA